ncbi:ATP-grasp fold amidoligase family protein [Jannaschia seohaensis]|uniref:Teichuronopeptide biosynthesis TupA-like protein n=1 Tax=Jannaschia seohaensis TaxID=475081 RepID=A0A2Y9AVG9_9RHOB|nr:ATP-grasp fold amidoligase family protein [Jannaschia seohaensis]PWJ16996.1 teichuronopeptide biosynthesis TupA-like protein [Jannaschia seohaensis]SSA48311.1 TupA-like ATPgrasp [Jannaschia seohaensis]
MRPSRLSGLPFADCAVLLAAELWIALRAPRLMVNSWRRARAQGFRPFHALPLAGDEKFLWRKVVDRDPLHVVLSDKLAARDWVGGLGLDLPERPAVLWRGERAEDLPDCLLTEDAVVKVNHNSGGVHVVARDGSDPAVVRKRVRGWLTDDFGRRNGEWAYLAVPREIFIEHRVGRAGVPLEDWKFYVFGGRIARVVRIDPESRPKAGQAFQPDAQGKLRLLPDPPGICRVRKKAPIHPRFREMVRAARALGRGLDHVRVDFLADDRGVWLGELTLYSEGGKFVGNGYDPDVLLSRAWDLREAPALREITGGPVRRLYLRVLRRALALRGS